VNTLDDPQRAALEGLVRQDLARRRLLDFAHHVYPNFAAPPHIRLIADLLEQAERKVLRRIAISVPVRHGKSVLGSQLFPAWFVGRHPALNIILASHAEDLATRNSRAARSFLQDDRWPFPDVRLATDSQSAQRWNTSARGGVFAIGVGGGITGRGADGLIIDDALHDGLSDAECESAFRWYSEVAVPRLEPGGFIVVIGARFSTNDLIGRILESDDGPNWHVVNLPALAGEDDPLGRAPGAALWPERMDIAEIEMRRSIMGSHAFESQFLQRPTPRGGAMFKRGWFAQRYVGGIPATMLPDPRVYAYESVFGTSEARPTPQPPAVVMAVDTASKTGISNDYSALATVACDRSGYYIVDVVRERLEFADLLRCIQSTYEKWLPAYIFVEAASSGIPIVQELKRCTRLPVIGVPPKGSKIARAEAVTPWFESGNVYIPQRARWIEQFLDEICAFPVGRHDDVVDAAVLALSMVGNVHAQRQKRDNSQIIGWMAR